MKTQRSVFVYPATLGFALALFSTPSLAQVQPDQPAQTAPAPSADTAAKKEPVVIPDRKLTSEGRMMLIRGLNAELGFARKPFPMGKTGLKINANNGEITPDDQHLEAIMAGYGPSVKVGDRARITNVKFKDKSILFDINGGPERKKKWYEHITISGGGGAISPGAPTDETNLRGSLIELTFDKYVPDLTPEQVKQLLDPVLNFHAKSATEAYLETIPPKAKEAIRDHKVLVGMNREMVTYAKGRPPQKHREKDGDVEYEEWIYGTPPQVVEFIRFVGDEVVRVESMEVDGTKVVRTDKEITLEKEQPQVAQQGQPPVETPSDTSSDSEKTPGRPPTLKRPGEETSDPGMSGPKSNPRPNTVPDPNDAPKPPGS